MDVDTVTFLMLEEDVNVSRNQASSLPCGKCGFAYQKYNLVGRIGCRYRTHEERDKKIPLCKPGKSQFRKVLLEEMEACEERIRRAKKGLIALDGTVEGYALSDQDEG